MKYLLKIFNIHQVERKYMILRSNIQPTPLLIQKKRVITGAVGQAIESDHIVGVHHF